MLLKYCYFVVVDSYYLKKEIYDASSIYELVLKVLMCFYQAAVEQVLHVMGSLPEGGTDSLPYPVVRHPSTRKVCCPVLLLFPFYRSS